MHTTKETHTKTQTTNKQENKQTHMDNNDKGMNTHIGK